MSKAGRQYFFAGFKLDLDTGLLWCGGEEVTLRPKLFELLTYFVENHGRLIGKHKLIETLWKDAAVTDNSLAQCVLELRKALGDHSQKLIRTVPRRGYMFTEEVLSSDASGVGQVPVKTPGPRTAVPTDRPRWKPAVRSLSWIAVGLVIWIAWWVTSRSLLGIRPGDNSISGRAIAVMPFSAEPATSVDLAGAIGEEIRNTLARSPKLRIVARSSTLRFKEGSPDAREIGRQLGVGRILKGRVREMGGRVQVSVDLVNPFNGRPIWSETFNRSTSEIFFVQAEIAAAVVARLNLEQARHVSHAPSPEAYASLLKGRYSEPGPPDSQVRLNYFRQSVGYDPDYAEGWAAIGGEWLRRAMEGSVRATDVIGEAKSAVSQALQLDDSLADAHFLRAMISWTYDWDWPSADREFGRALALNPNSAAMHVQYARFLALMGRREAALGELENIRALDPISAEGRSIEAAVYYFSGDYDRTIQHAQAILSASPQLWPMYFWLGRAYESKGQLAEAIAALEKSYRGPGRSEGRGFGMLASCYARVGRRAEALRLLERATTSQPQTHFSPASVALIYLGLGDNQRALDWLEKAYEERDQSLVSLRADPAYVPLQSSPRFTAILQRLKL